MSDTKTKFEAAVTRSKALPTQPTNVQLELYGLYKQATAGDVSTSRPGMLDMRGRAKWDAWSKLKGKSSEEAMEAYVEAIDRLS